MHIFPFWLLVCPSMAENPVGRPMIPGLATIRNYMIVAGLHAGISSSSRASVAGEPGSVRSLTGVVERSEASTASDGTELVRNWCSAG